MNASVTVYITTVITENDEGYEVNGTKFSVNDETGAKTPETKFGPFLFSTKEEAEVFSKGNFLK